MRKEACSSASRPSVTLLLLMQAASFCCLIVGISIGLAASGSKYDFANGYSVGFAKPQGNQVTTVQYQDHGQFMGNSKPEGATSSSHSQAPQCDMKRDVSWLSIPDCGISLALVLIGCGCAEPPFPHDLSLFAKYLL